MHGNEIRINHDNLQILMHEAEQLGPAYITALNEQIQRQNEKK
jgi:hypothetical protein